MEKAKTKYGIVEAAFAINKHRNTITRHIKSGKLSCTMDVNKTKWIDAAELHRVYGDAFDPNREEGAREKASSKTSKDAHAGTIQVQELLDREIRERDRERKQYLDQIESLKESLAAAQEGHNRATLLLGDQSNWQQAIDTLKTQVEQDQEKAREDAKNREERLRRLLKAEKEKSIWAKLVGK